MGDDNGIFGADRRGLTLSVIFHVLMVLVGAFGLPALLPDSPPPEPMVMTVDILPISAMTNVKPSQEPISEKKETPKPPVKAPEPPKPAPPKPAPKVEKPVEKPTPKEEKMPEKVEEKHFDPDEGKEPDVKKEPPKPAPPKPTPAKTESDFDKMMRDLKEQADKTSKDAKDTTNTPENKTKSDAPYDDSMPLSLSEKDAIRNQFTPCWSPPAGAKDAASLIVILKAQYQQDGKLIDVQISPKVQGRYNSDPFFRAAADSAMRAVHMCTPLKNMDMSKYGSWKDMELTFDPKMYN